MGVRGLRTKLSPYSTLTSLSQLDDTPLMLSPSPLPLPLQSPSLASRTETPAVIDGPSLAHHAYKIFNNCSSRKQLLNCLNASVLQNQRTDSATLSLRYSGPTQIFFAWLDALEAHGCTVTSILFDGALPHWKRAIRKERMADALKQLTKLSQINLSSLVKQDEDITSTIGSLSFTYDDLFNTEDNNGTLLSSLRPVFPTFLVSCILEALCLHSRYRSIVRIVPDEADLYCAIITKQVGAILFTNDSDALLYDLGPNGRVVFLDQMQYVSQPPNLKLRIYCPTKLSNTFNLGDSLISLGFVIDRKYHNHNNWSWNRILEESRSIKVNRPKAFIEFDERYNRTCSEQIPDQIIQGFDVAISEWLCQIYYYYRLPKHSTNKAESFDTPPTIWLPILLENLGQSPAWDSNIANALRCLAYSILACGECSATKEIRRSKTVNVEHFTTLEVPIMLQTTNDLILQAVKFIGDDSKIVSWRQVALYCLVRDLQLEKQKFPTPKNMLHVYTGLVLGRSWQEIHLFARLQALCASWRFLHHAITKFNVFWANDPKEVSEDMVNMKQTMEHHITNGQWIEMVDGIVEFDVNQTKNMLSNLYVEMDVEVDVNVDVEVMKAERKLNDKSSNDITSSSNNKQRRIDRENNVKNKVKNRQRLNNRYSILNSLDSS